MGVIPLSRRPIGPCTAQLRVFAFPLAMYRTCFDFLVCCSVVGSGSHCHFVVNQPPSLPYRAPSPMTAHSRSTLCSEPMVDFMEHNVLVWGGSLMHGEAYAVGNALDVCAFPYVGLLLCKQNQVQVCVCAWFVSVFLGVAPSVFKHKKKSSENQEKVPCLTFLLCCSRLMRQGCARKCRLEVRVGETSQHAFTRLGTAVQVVGASTGRTAVERLLASALRRSRTTHDRQRACFCLCARVLSW